MGTSKAEEVAMWNPPHAIRGWLSGSIADGDDAGASLYAEALDIQRGWRA